MFILVLISLIGVILYGLFQLDKTSIFGIYRVWSIIVGIWASFVIIILFILSILVMIYSLRMLKVLFENSSDSERLYKIKVCVNILILAYFFHNGINNPFEFLLCFNNTSYSSVYHWNWCSINGILYPKFCSYILLYFNSIFRLHYWFNELETY